MSKSLSYWRDTPTKQAILDFVAEVTDENGSEYVTPADRIATFDNDGTLWCEKPTYFQFLFAIERLKEIAAADTALLEKVEYKAALDNDLDYFTGLYPGNIPALMEIFFNTHAGMIQSEFVSMAYAFMSETKHPRFSVPLKNLVYKPMVELIRYLMNNEFKVFIASAGGMSFVRPLAEEIYGIPRERVIGSNNTFELREINDKLVLYRSPGLIEPFDDGPGKPVNIELHIGRVPILAGGNADGDIEMLSYSESSGRKSLQLVLHHDDPKREYAYEGPSAQKVFGLAERRGWIVISMKDDWEVVFG